MARSCSQRTLLTDRRSLRTTYGPLRRTTFVAAGIGSSGAANPGPLTLDGFARAGGATLAFTMAGSFAGAFLLAVFAVSLVALGALSVANDSFGHDVGDAALRTVGDCLARVFLRRCDLVCRSGGDEFAVVWSGGWSRSQARKL